LLLSVLYCRAVWFVLTSLVCSGRFSRGEFARYDGLMVGFLQAKLAEVSCQRHGWVLDDFPRNQTQAVGLFGTPPLSAEQKRARLPDLVASLEADEAFLQERVLNMPEHEFSAKYSTIDHALQPRLDAYKAPPTDVDQKKKSAEPPTSSAKMVHAYFASCFGVGEPVAGGGAGAVEGQLAAAATAAAAPLAPSYTARMATIDATHETTAAGTNFAVEDIRGRIGPPRNFGTARNLSFDEVTSHQRVARTFASRHEQRERAEAANAAAAATAAAAVKGRRQDAAQSNAALEGVTQPARRFMVKHVMPTLTEALIAVSEARPADPIKFIAAYLRQHTRGPVPQCLPPSWPGPEEVLTAAPAKRAEAAMEGGAEKHEGGHDSAASADEAVATATAAKARGRSSAAASG
jgi:adenylate kinase